MVIQIINLVKRNLLFSCTFLVFLPVLSLAGAVIPAGPWGCRGGPVCGFESAGPGKGLEAVVAADAAAHFFPWRAFWMAHSPMIAGAPAERIQGFAVVVAGVPSPFFFFHFSHSGAKTGARKGLSRPRSAASAGGAQRRALTSPEHSVAWEREKWK